MPRTCARDPLPASVTEHEDPEHETLLTDPTTADPETADLENAEAVTELLSPVRPARGVPAQAANTMPTTAGVTTPAEHRITGLMTGTAPQEPGWPQGLRSSRAPTSRWVGTA